MHRSLSLAAAFLLATGPAALAGPYACTRALLQDGFASISYIATRVDRIADYSFDFGFSASPGCPAGSGGAAPIDGRINLATDNGIGSLSRDGTTEQYAVSVRGTLGDEFFDDPDEFGRFIGFESRATPLFRLNFSPLAGYDPAYLFPNGFSVSSRLCEAGPGECGPFYAVGSEPVAGREVPYFIFSDGGAPIEVGTVPLPAALPLGLAGLAALAGLGWRRRRAG